MAPRTVLLISSPHVGWHAVHHALAALPDCRVIGDTTDTTRVLQLAADHRPTMIIASPTLDGEPTVPLLTTLHVEISPASTIVLFAADCAPHHFVGGVERWLSGFLIWHQLTPDSLRHCFAALLNGDIVLGNRATTLAFAAALRGEGADPTIAAKVSERDRAVLRELAEGRKVREIARRLSLGDRTVRRSIERLEEVLDAPDRFVLAVKAMRAGLLR